MTLSAWVDHCSCIDKSWLGVVAGTGSAGRVDGVKDCLSNQKPLGNNYYIEIMIDRLNSGCQF